MVTDDYERRRHELHVMIDLLDAEISANSWRFSTTLRPPTHQIQPILII